MSNGANWSLSCLPRANLRKAGRFARLIALALKESFGFSATTHAGKICPNDFYRKALVGVICANETKRTFELTYGILSSQYWMHEVDWTGKKYSATEPFRRQKGRRLSEKQNAAREKRLWRQRMVRAYRPEYALFLRRLMNRN